MDQHNEARLQRLNDADFEVAPSEPDVRDWTVVTRDGHELGTVDDLIVDTDAMKVRYLEVDLKDRVGAAEEDLYLPIGNVELDKHAEHVIVNSGAIADLRRLAPVGIAGQLGRVDRSPDRSAAGGGIRGSKHDEQRITRSEEELNVGKRTAQTGEVRVGKHVETERVRESVPVAREDVHVERRPVSERQSGEIRASGKDEISVPIVEEEIVTEKRPVVKEELIVSKDRVEGSETVEADLRKERFDIDEDRHREGTGRRRVTPRTGGE